MKSEQARAYSLPVLSQVDGDAASATPVKAAPAPKKRGMVRKMGTRPLHSEAAMEKFEDKDE